MLGRGILTAPRRGDIGRFHPKNPEMAKWDFLYRTQGANWRPQFLCIVYRVMDSGPFVGG